MPRATTVTTIEELNRLIEIARTGLIATFDEAAFNATEEIIAVALTGNPFLVRRACEVLPTLQVSEEFEREA